jgi:hypothetical protein
VDLSALLSSKKFRAWRPSADLRLTCLDERHYTPQELAKLWGVSVQTIRDLFRREDGVLKIGSNGTRTRRGYKTLRIPESVAERVHTRLSGC